jgi:LPS export ABC transporter protein LptC
VDKILIFFIPIILILSCSLEYDSSVSESLDESIPTSKLYGVKHVQIQGGQAKVSFEAEQAVIWKEREETELMNFVFNEFGNDGEIITTGEADYLIISDMHDAEIIGNIFGYSQRNEASISADNISWIDEKRLLTSNEESDVIITKDNGSLLKGRGFSADMYTNTTTFSSGISGKLESRDSDE